LDQIGKIEKHLDDANKSFVNMKSTKKEKEQKKANPKKEEKKIEYEDLGDFNLLKQSGVGFNNITNQITNSNIYISNNNNNIVKNDEKTNSIKQKETPGENEIKFKETPQKKASEDEETDLNAEIYGSTKETRISKRRKTSANTITKKTKDLNKELDLDFLPKECLYNQEKDYYDSKYDLIEAIDILEKAEEKEIINQKDDQEREESGWNRFIRFINPFKCGQ
jgi:hypothetical protein